MKLALIGGRLSHSYSEIIHNLFFEYTGIKGSYELIEVPDANQLGEKVQWFQKNNYSGINVTIPYKEKILQFTDSQSSEVNKLQAANTLHFIDGQIKAYNTDYFGFMRTLEISDINPEGMKWLVLGYGGGAKSVITGLKDMGAAEIKVAHRSHTGREFIRFNEIENLNDYTGVVNTTPLGMFPDIETCRLTQSQIKQFSIVVDIVYNPLETKLLKRADQAGIKTVKGLYMLVAQAVKAQEIWQNREFDDDLIDRIYKEVGAGL